MSQPFPEKFTEVAVPCKANIYFDGKVISHTLLFADGSRKSLGLIYPGTFTFATAAPERMMIVAGSCRAKIAGSTDWSDYPAGTFFDIPGNSSFEISVADGIAEYICSFG